MSTVMSSRREFVAGKSEAKTSGTGWAVIALIAGVVVMAVGISVDVTAVFAVGSIAFVCSFLYLNSMFWANWMEKTDYKPSSLRHYYL